MQKEAKEKKQKESRTKAILAAKDRAVPTGTANSKAPLSGGSSDDQTGNGLVKHKKKKKR